MKNKTRTNGFTLAETLITLGIIGLVAAIILPSLVADYKKKVETIKFKKTYAVMETAFERIMAADNVDSLLRTRLYKNKQKNDIDIDYLAKYLKFERTNYTYQLYNGGIPNLRRKSSVSRQWGGLWGYSNYNAYFIRFPDTGVGVKIEIFEPTILTKSECNVAASYGGRVCSNLASIVFDTNGKKGPNVKGIDIFEFSLSAEGKIYPTCGVDEAARMTAKRETSFSNRYWRTNSGICGIPGKRISSRIDGYGCAGRIFENDFMKDY
ncbi:type II secretion system protein [bacterium]|nr:type II secretion system protein [bacterium]